MIISVFKEITAERARQEEKFPDQRLPDGTGGFTADAMAARRTCEVAALAGCVTWRHVLLEEVFEAMAEVDEHLLRDELVQVAAVAVRWIEDIDGR